MLFLSKHSLLINKKNNFTYKKTNEGATFYTLVYHPINKSKSTRNRSLTLFLGKGTVKLKGEARFKIVEKDSIVEYQVISDTLKYNVQKKKEK